LSSPIPEPMPAPKPGSLPMPFGLVLLFGLLLPAAVYAQTAEAEPEADAEPEVRITVTAPALPELGALETELPLGESTVPASSLPDLVGRLPGLSFDAYSEEPRQAAVQYRGYGSSHLPLVLDGHKVNPPDLGRLPWGGLPVGAIESVKLLRGPRAARYGSGAITGVLLVETTPESEGGYFRGGLGSHGYQDLEAGATVKAGAALVTASGEIYRRDGQRENSDSTGGSSLVSVFRSPGDPLDAPELRASLGYSQVAYGFPGAISPELLTEDPDAASTPDDRGESTRVYGSADLSWLRPEAEVALPVYLAYRSDRGDFASFGTKTVSDTSTARLEPSVHAVLPGIRDLEVSGGISGEFIHLGSSVDSTEVTDQRFLRPALGVFSSALLPLPGGWAVGAGGRYDLAVLRAEGAIDERTTLQGIGGDASLHYESTRMRSTLRVAAVYRLPKIDEIALYQGFGTGFNADLSPERGVAVDLGVRIEAWESISFRAGVFGTFLRDEIAFVFDPSAGIPPFGQNENIDSTRRLGAEAEAQVGLGGGIDLFGGYSFVDPRYASGDNEGNLLPGVPRNSANASMVWGAIDWLEVTARYQLFGPYHDAPSNEGALKYRRDLLSVGTALTFSGGAVDWSLAFAGENLLDDRDPSVAFPTGLYPTSGRRFRISLGGSY
jgi:outer membrane receptor protein involved in Fe transport